MAHLRPCDRCKGPAGGPEGSPPRRLPCARGVRGGTMINDYLLLRLRPYFPILFIFIVLVLVENECAIV